MSLNRGKESIVLNLKSHKDKKVFDKLLANSDVLIENYRPKTMEKLQTYLGEVSRFQKAERLYAKKAAGHNHFVA